MSKFIVVDSSSIVQAKDDDVCCIVCTFRDNTSLCTVWDIEVEDDTVCPEWEAQEDIEEP
jgi:hypothetical protein